MASSFRTDTLPNLCAGIGLIPLCIGVYGVARPRGILGIFEFQEPPASPESQKLTVALCRLFAWRDIAAGATYLAVWYSGDRTALGWVSIAGCIACIGDCVVSVQHTGGGLLKHVGALPLLAGGGAALLGWI